MPDTCSESAVDAASNDAEERTEEDSVNPENGIKCLSERIDLKLTVTTEAEFSSADEWIAEMHSLIPDDWSFVKAMQWRLSYDKLVTLDATLRSLYTSFCPLRDGSWGNGLSVQPARWTDTFRWMACPASRIRAIFVLKEPLENSAISSYESTGIALGVKRKLKKMAPEFGHISQVLTLRKTVEFVHYLQNNRAMDEAAEAEVCERFHHGFHVDRLSSASGILFLNVFPTTGPEAGIKIWGDFAEALLHNLASMFRNSFRIPVFLLYTTRNMGALLMKHSVYVPLGTPWISHWSHPDYLEKPFCIMKENPIHVAYFTDEHIEKYCSGIVAYLERCDEETVSNFRLVLRQFYEFIFGKSASENGAD